MRSVSTACVVVLLAARLASADDVNVEAFEYVDVVETSDGSIVKGVIGGQPSDTESGKVKCDRRWDREEVRTFGDILRGSLDHFAIGSRAWW